MHVIKGKGQRGQIYFSAVGRKKSGYEKMIYMILYEKLYYNISDPNQNWFSALKKRIEAQRILHFLNQGF